MLILIYVSICYVIFKIFKIPVNQSLANLGARASCFSPQARGRTN
jgi:hypothetical protein